MFEKLDSAVGAMCAAHANALEEIASLAEERVWRHDGAIATHLSVPQVCPKDVAEGPSPGALGRGGGTDLENLVLLCHAHHRVVYEGGWSTTGHPAKDLRFHDPTGRALRSPTGRGDSWLQPAMAG